MKKLLKKSNPKLRLYICNPQNEESYPFNEWLIPIWRMHGRINGKITDTQYQIRIMPYHNIIHWHLIGFTKKSNPICIYQSKIKCDYGFNPDHRFCDDGNADAFALAIINKAMDVIIENCEGYDCRFKLPIGDWYPPNAKYADIDDCKNQIKSYLKSRRQ